MRMIDIALTVGGIRMRMSFAGRGDENDRYREWWQNMGMDCARGGENRKGRTRNGQNMEWQNAE
jgi:hypothetical protein